MSNRDQTSLNPTDRHSSGPQGTRLFAATELRQYVGEADPRPTGQANGREPVLAGISAAVEGLRFHLRAGRQTIGRSTSNDIVVDDPSVSSSHAWIIGQHRQYAIVNTLSTNGTFVNDKRIHETTLKHADRVRFGQAEFVFLTHEPGAARSAPLRWIVAGSLLAIGLAVLTWWVI